MKFTQSVVALVAAAGLTTASPVKRQAAPITDADSAFPFSLSIAWLRLTLNH